jgi:hypothetical protein
VLLDVVNGPLQGVERLVAQRQQSVTDAGELRRICPTKMNRTDFPIGERGISTSAAVRVRG